MTRYEYLLAKGTSGAPEPGGASIAELGGARAERLRESQREKLKLQTDGKLCGVCTELRPRDTERSRVCKHRLS
eukprot:COSAG03_NODE_14591_length_458_cov_10.189415_1_plen_73_part_10